MKNLLIIIFLFSNLNLIALSPNFLEKIRETRKGCQNIEGACAEAVQMLPIYGDGETLSASIQEMLKEECSSVPDDGTLQPLSNTELAGNSSDPVYFLLDSKKDLLMVIKAFENPQDKKSSFIPEISSLDFIQNHPELGVKVPEPLAVGKTHFQGKWYGLLAQTPAKGKRIDTYFTAGKKDKLESLFKDAGEVFAKFNGTTKRAIPVKWADKLRKQLDRIEKGPAREILSDSLDTASLVQYVDQVISETLSKEFLSGYAHFSPHPGNVFYEEEENQIWLIDVAYFHTSFDKEENPLSFSSLDLVTFIERFRKKSSLTFEEMEHLSSLAVDSYLSITKDPHAEILIEFLFLDAILDKLVQYAKKENPNKKDLQILETVKKQLIEKCRVKEKVLSESSLPE